MSTDLEVIDRRISLSKEAEKLNLEKQPKTLQEKISRYVVTGKLNESQFQLLAQEYAAAKLKKDWDRVQDLRYVAVFVDLPKSEHMWTFKARQPGRSWSFFDKIGNMIDSPDSVDNPNIYWAGVTGAPV